MRSTTAPSDADTPRSQLHQLTILLEEALAESNALHHRIREVQLRLAELNASLEAGRLVAAIRASG